MFAFAFSATASAVAAQQTSVDIAVAASFANGAVSAQVTRKDPSDVKPADIAKVMVSAALKGQKPFFSTTIVLKPGGSQSVSAPYSGPAGGTVTVSAMPLDLKEINPADNTRDVSTGILMAAPMTVPILKTGSAKAPSPSTTPASPPPAKPAAAPASSPSPSATAITTTQLVLVGGTTGAVAAAATGTTISTAAIVLRGGAQVTVATASGKTITTSPITLIGR